MYCKVLLAVYCSVTVTVFAVEQDINDNKDELVVNRKVVKVGQNGPITGNVREFCTVDVQAYSGYDSSCHGENEGFVKLNGNTVWEAGWCSTKRNLRGVTIVHIDTSSVLASSIQRFDTHANESNAVALTTYLKQLPQGAVIVGVTGDEPTATLGPALETLKSMGVDVRDVPNRGNFAFVLQKDYSFEPVVVKGLGIGVSPAKFSVRLEEETRILVQQHASGTTFFSRTWDEFKNEFGDVNSNYWIGNDRLVALTAGESYKLRVELLAKYDSQWYWAEYNTFRVLDERTGYVLWVDGYDPSSTAGDSLYDNNGMRFSTKDRDYDTYCGASCAVGNDHGNNAGFWYSACGFAFINSPVNGAYSFTWYHLPVGTAGNWADKKLLISRVYLVTK